MKPTARAKESPPRICSPNSGSTAELDAHRQSQVPRQREIHAAAQWWSQNRLAAPGAVAADLKEALELLVEAPGTGTKVEDARDPETRRWWLDRVGHYIYYRPRGRHLEVVAFWGGGCEHGPSV